MFMGAAGIGGAVARCGCVRGVIGNAGVSAMVVAGVACGCETSDNGVAVRVIDLPLR
jgi:hypothetical protein